MANKLFKHFGFPGKKVSNQSSPSHDYSSSKTSGTIPELSKSPTKSRIAGAAVVVSPSSCGPIRPEFDGRRHSDAAAVRSSLPGRGRNKSTPPDTSAEWSLSRGARPKDRYASCRVPATAGSDSSSAAGHIRSKRYQQQSSVAGQSDGSVKLPLQCAESLRSPQMAVPATNSCSGLSPQILAEYSDPFDLKKVIEQTENSADASCVSPVAAVQNDDAADEDLPLKSEDDYSVPYEIKNRLKDSQQQISNTEAEITPKYDDPYAEGPVLLSPAAVVSENGSRTSPHHQTDSSSDDTASHNMEVKLVCDSTDSSFQPASANYDDAGATYEEPWDLMAARIGLENRLRAVHSSPDQLASMNSLEQSRLNDPRPALEYDEPWDNRAKDVRRNLISAKSAKEEARAQREGGLHSQMFHGTFRNAQDGTRLVVAPADLKSNSSLSKAGGNPCCWSYRSMAAPSQAAKHRCVQDARDFLSSCKPCIQDFHEMQSSCRSVAERIDPRVPLEQQGWYHGSISRVDAETLLRVHREGSYLVRMSESNRVDYSLSFKSARGFMHMKIVGTKNGGDSGVGCHYILGQFSQPFDSIPQMIHHYTINKLPIKGAEHMSLLHPVNNELL